MKSAETQERKYLEVVKKKLRNVLEDIHSKVQRYSKEIREQKEYLWENKSGMDHVEKISVRQSVTQAVLTAEAVQDRSRRINKLLQSPYFGRFDFIYKSEKKENPIYVGVHAFYDEEDDKNLIHDWRAPISTMFYDYETGAAQFEAPDGIIKGKIILKRQYRIRNGQMDFMLESDISIHDDVLQKELSLSSDDKMKNIVATIQRDQNAIIRNEHSDVLIIQGVAGSGKTSIALHRIAFLLYRFKKEITSKDILIISPNKVFADYISNVLPELGEEKIPEVGIEQLARELLGTKYKFQTFAEQVIKLLDADDKSFQMRIQAKASFEFLQKLDEYLEYIETEYFTSEDLRISGCLVPSWFMKEKFENHNYLPINRRLQKIVNDIEQNIGIYYHYNVTTKERNEIKAAVRKMFKCQSLAELYKDFYHWLKKPDLYKSIKTSDIEYSDVFPLIYLQMKWDGVNTYEDVKHLLVDEMQDYTPVQYAVLSKVFNCKKTILGDANQSVNPFSSSSAEVIRKVFKKTDCVKLNKSYRSTFEITNFAQKISPNQELEAVKRHGDKPEIIGCKNKKEEVQRIKNVIKSYQNSSYHSLGIICKTHQQAQKLYKELKSDTTKVHLFSLQSERFVQGIIITSAHMAKGLEFDCVIVPQATSENYMSEMDRSMLYVACTRAMHQLTLTYIGKISEFLKAGNTKRDL